MGEQSVTRRANGTWRKRGNKYELQVSAGIGLNGKRLRYTRTVEAASIREVDKLLAIFITDVDGGQINETGKLTFKGFISKWLNDYVYGNLSDKTIEGYEQRLNDRILPALGHIKLSKLRQSHLLTFYSNLKENGIRSNERYKSKKNLPDYIKKTGLSQKKFAILAGVSENTMIRVLNGCVISSKTAMAISCAINCNNDHVFEKIENNAPLSPRSIMHYHRLISSILQKAVEWQIIKSNPATNLRPVSVPSEEIDYYEENNIYRLIECLNNEKFVYRLLIILDIDTGIRRGEVLALEWADVDFKSKSIYIKKALQHTKKTGAFIKSPKSKKGFRNIRISDFTIDYLKLFKKHLKEQKLKAGDKWIEGDRIFVSDIGKPLALNTVSNWFGRLIKKNDLPHITLHGLRHTSASYLISSGLDVISASGRLGHAKISTTLNSYGHIYKKTDEEAASKLQQLFHVNAANLLPKK